MSNRLRRAPASLRIAGIRDLHCWAKRFRAAVQDVSAVSAPTGTFVSGDRVGPPLAPTGVARGSAFLTVRSTVPLFSDSSKTQLDRLRELPGPDGQAVLMGGGAQVSRDTVDAVTSRLPWVAGLIAVTTFVLLFLLTGSVVLPLKALVLNVLSLSAAFGALAWIFQDGRLGALGTTSTGTLEVTLPVLLLGIAFGLSMDYEVFLLSRIREYWLASPRTRADNSESVALGLARTGRVITAAALIMSIAFAALIPAQVSFMRMFGIGLTLAVLVDATLVRMALVPAFMQVMGRWNWWAPKPMVRLHERIGFSEEPPGKEPPGIAVDSAHTVAAATNSGERARAIVREAEGGVGNSIWWQPTGDRRQGGWLLAVPSGPRGRRIGVRI